MKKFFMGLAVLALGSVCTISAATVTCRIGTADLTANTTTPTCAGTSAAFGFVIIGVNVEALTGYTGNDSGEGITVNVNYSLFGTNADWAHTGTMNSSSSEPFSTIFTANIGPTASILPFTVTQFNSVLNDVGVVFNGAISGQVRYTTIEQRATGTAEMPEPATYAMLGSALVALGLLRRRKA